MPIQYTAIFIDAKNVFSNENTDILSSPELKAHKVSL